MNRLTPALLRLSARLRWFSVFIASVLVGASGLRAQSVHWESGDSSMGNVVQLVFEDCEPDGDPQLPNLPNATLSLAGQSTSINAVNLSVTRSVILSYLVQARNSSPLKIPTFTVKTNKGPMRVAEFNAGAPSVSAESVASSKLIPDRTTLWAGEVFGLTYKLLAARRNNPQINPTFEWNAAPLVAEDWSKPEVNETVVDGQRDLEVTYHTRAYAKTPNTLKLEAATHLIQVQTGSVGFGFLSQPRMEPVSVTSDQPVLEIRPLPPAPAGFTGAVGNFKLVSKVVPKQAAVGDPITWTLELSGTGNWPDIAGLPSREVSKDFQVVQPKAKRTPAEGKLFDVTLTEDVVLVPTKAGFYTLPPVTFVYFNPQTGAYETIRTEATAVTVTPPPAPQFPSNPAPAPAAQTPTATAAATPSSKAIESPALPAGIPRDPLPGHAMAAAPMSRHGLFGWLITPFVGLLLFWLTLAWRRAAKTDPLRPRREAHARLVALVADLQAHPPASASAGRPLSPAERDALAARLLQWQHDAATLWELSHAAPAPKAIPDIEWESLWRDADRTLYGANVNLPPDWIARAQAALAAKRVPGFMPARLFLPRNLLPFAAAIALLLVLALPTLRADEASAPKSTLSATANYGAGNFAAAEDTWRADIAQHPTDWIARHNLALALMQQDKSDEAMAQAAAAFVQHPTDPSVRWHFALTAEKAGVAPMQLLPLLKEGPAAAVATLAGPAEWQRILILATFALAIGLGWMLFNAYGRRTRLQFWIAGAVCAAAIVVQLAAMFGIDMYAETSDIRAAIAWRAGTLHSIPTEAATTQKTTALAAGAVGIVDKTFLGWDRLSFPNGQTGWVRKEEVVPIWQ